MASLIKRLRPLSESDQIARRRKEVQEGLKQENKKMQRETADFTEGVRRYEATRPKRSKKNGR